MDRSAGLFGVRVERADQLDDGLRAAFSQDGPALVNATRTILPGGGDEIVELTKTSLRDLRPESPASG